MACESIAGEQIGYDIAAAADEDKVVVMSIGEGCLIGFCYRGVCVAVELMTAGEFCNVFCRNGSVCGSLREIVAGILGC